MNEHAAAIPNPLQRVRRRSRRAVCIAAPLIGACGWWCFAPLKASTSIAPPRLDVAGPQGPGESQDHAPINPSVFAVALWNPAPPAQGQTAADSTPPAPPSPLNIQLIGIITDTVDGIPIQKAAIYDADADRLLIIADGEKLREHVVRVLSAGVVELVDGETTRQYRLRTDLDSPERGPT